MPFPLHRRSWLSPLRAAVLCVCAIGATCATFANAQAPPPSAKDIRAADDAYIAGARLLTANDPVAAERSFARALALDPTNPNYPLSLAIAREHHVTMLVQRSARERHEGRIADADRDLAEATRLDPTNPIVTAHNVSVLAPDALPHAIGPSELAQLGGAIHLAPTGPAHSFHLRSDSRDLLRQVYTAFGIQPTFDDSLMSQPLRFDLDDADFATATRIALRMTHSFPVALTASTVLLAKDTQENRDRLQPLLEETVYVPAMPAEQITELSTIAKSIFDIKQVSIPTAGGQLILRGPEDALNLVNATYADLLDGGGEVILDVHFYEVDLTHERNIGAVLPTSAGVIALEPALQNLVNANQALVQQLIAAGLKLTGNPIQDLAIEGFALISSGLVTLPASLTNLLGVFGNFGKYTNAAGQLVGVPLAGVYLGSSSSFNLAFNSSDVRLVDAIQLRISDRKDGTFRAGVRYPITTSTYSTGISTAAASALAGVKIGGVSVGSLLAQAGNATTIPQVQFEDLGLTFKATPQVLRSGQVFVHFDLKIEALGGGQINNIPILNSRNLTDDVTIPEGQTALLVSQTSVQEMKAIAGVPGLSEIPGFQGTDKDVTKDTQELIISVTPRLIRRRSESATSRRLPANLAPPTD